MDTDPAAASASDATVLVAAGIAFVADAVAPSADVARPPSTSAPHALAPPAFAGLLATVAAAAAAAGMASPAPPQRIGSAASPPLVLRRREDDTSQLRASSEAQQLAYTPNTPTTPQAALAPAAQAAPMLLPPILARVQGVHLAFLETLQYPSPEICRQALQHIQQWRQGIWAMSRDGSQLDFAISTRPQVAHVDRLPPSPLKAARAAVQASETPRSGSIRAVDSCSALELKGVPAVKAHFSLHRSGIQASVSDHIDFSILPRPDDWGPPEDVPMGFPSESDAEAARLHAALFAPSPPASFAAIKAAPKRDCVPEPSSGGKGKGKGKPRAGATSDVASGPRPRRYPLEPVFRIVQLGNCETVIRRVDAWSAQITFDPQDVRPFLKES